MSQSTSASRVPAQARLRHGALVGALLLGVLAEWLVRAPGRPGLGVSAWALAGVAVIALLFRLRAAPAAREARLLIAAALGFAVALALRDAAALAAFGLLSSGLLLVLAAGRGGGAWLGHARPGDVAVATLRVALAVVTGPAGWRRAAASGADADAAAGAGAARWRRGAGTLARGTLMALPALVLLTSLLVAADPVFAGILHGAARLDLGALVDELAFAAAVAWAVSGYLRALLCAEEGPVADARLPRPALAPAEVAVALWTLNLLFAVFMAVQLRYLYGGADLVEVTPGLTYAEYARRGFFELVAVAMLVVPILLLADWAAASGESRARAVLRRTMLVLVGLLFGVLASAAYRMALYQQAYGLTELRLYASACLAWLVFTFGWLAHTVLSGRRERFAAGALLAGVAVVAALHGLNPHALIARVNVERAATGAYYDVEYLRSLGADAVPTLVANLHRLPAAERCRVAALLDERWADARTGGWRTWNLADARARRLVAAGHHRGGCPRVGAVP